MTHCGLFLTLVNPIITESEIQTTFCPNLDELGFRRPVLQHRICDGRLDCPGGSDENGEMALCNHGGGTNNGCCSSLLTSDDERFDVAGLLFGRDFYQSVDNPDHVIFYLTDRWFLGRVRRH